MRRITSNTSPPIPTRTHDWCAIDDETYGGEEGDLVGYGATEIEAIRNLLDLIEERRAQ